MIRAWDYITIFVGVFMGLLPLLHVRRMVKESSSRGQSSAAVFLGIVSSSVWLVYGIGHELLVIILTSSTVLLTQAVWLITILVFRERQSGQG